MTAWNQRYGGVRWRLTAEGVEIEGDGLQRTAGEPDTMRRMLRVWGSEIRSVSIVSEVPMAILMMTLATEGALSWRGDYFAYPPHRIEPGYRSDALTPHRISIGPTHVLLSTYQSVMRAPKATRVEAAPLMSNLLAAGLYIRGRQALHRWDPILVAASYNAGGLYDASDQASQYHDRWHLRAYGNHLDRAARWYGDAVFVLAEDPPKPGPPNIAVPDRKIAA